MSNGEPEPQPRERRSTTIFIVSCAAVFLVIVACAAYFVVKLLS